VSVVDRDDGADGRRPVADDPTRNEGSGRAPAALTGADPSPTKEIPT